MEKGGKHKTFGRKMGPGPGFPYMDANEDKGITWGEDTPVEYLENPKQHIPGAKLIFAGSKKSMERAELIEEMSHDGFYVSPI